MELHLAIPLFILCAIVIGVAGTYLTKIADQFADISGLGEAMVGALLLGSVTSLSGIVTSVTAAWEGYPQLSVSNAIGGIAAQTAFLAVADIVYRKANLEHAAASLSNLMQTGLLIIMVSFLIFIINTPEITLFGVHPASVFLILIYILGIKMISRASEHPMWNPKRTFETILDQPDAYNLKNLSFKVVLAKFIGLAVIVGFAGYWVTQSGLSIATRTGLSESFVGSALTAIVTSLPELIVSITAVRQRALTLAVSNIVGGNCFDILFVAFADFAFPEGSILHHIGNAEVFIMALTLLLTSILLLGLLVREKTGIGRIGWESALILALFIVGYVMLYFM